MNEAQWAACSDLRKDQTKSEPDRNDALCLLTVFDDLDRFGMHNVTKRQLNVLAEEPEKSPGLASAASRFVANFEHLGHAIDKTDYPIATSVMGSAYLPETRVLSKVDLINMLKTPPKE